MIKIENFEVAGLTGSMPAIRGMRNPKRSHDKMDSYVEFNENDTFNINIGDNDKKLMLNLAKAGDAHAKWMRFVDVYMDITAPLYWWKEFDTYRFGVEKNSDSTMFNIEKKQFEFMDFSCEHLSNVSKSILNTTISGLNYWRELYLHGGIHNMENNVYLTEFKPKNKFCWWQMIQLLPTSYNQKRTVKVSLQALCHMYWDRKNHKLDEWHEFCDYVATSFLGEYITESKPR